MDNLLATCLAVLVPIGAGLLGMAYKNPSFYLGISLAIIRTAAVVFIGEMALIVGALAAYYVISQHVDIAIAQHDFGMMLAGFGFVAAISGGTLGLAVIARSLGKVAYRHATSKKQAAGDGDG